ncbi:MAG TPA: glycoside hydrolase family 9 protein [Opitutaceae bacterium]|nr:glycoside hydrolase family 9 protein [Opitutaceae bacterium]
MWYLKSIFGVVVLSFVCAFSFAREPDPRIRINSVGFLPDAPKQATIATDAKTFRVVRADTGVSVFDGALSAECQTETSDTDERVRTADFSTLHTPGRYRLEVQGVGESSVFVVSANVWNEPFQIVARSLYLWRCGTEVHTTWQGKTFQHAACHLEDGWLDFVGGGHVQRKSIGGWHDAGDYNKYIVNAGVTLGLMLKAVEEFPDRIGSAALNLPESGNGLPDLLNEARWELEWMLTMQADDGRVYHKLTARNFSYWGPADRDSSPRYFCPPGSTGIADFTATMAMSARNYRKYDAAFADRCLNAARLSWTWLVAHPQNMPPEQSAFSTGGYGAPDTTHRLWAAAELWATTQEVSFLKEFEQRAVDSEFSLMGPSWADVHDLALATYLETSSSQRNPALVKRLTDNLLMRAGQIVKTGEAEAYGRPLGGAKESWFWGANGSVAAQTFLLHLADRIRPDPSYRATAQNALGFLFGRNFHARSYVTGLGYRPPEHPHDRRGEPAWPGYLVGGGWPTGKSWVDERADFRQNEIAINWNASLIYALAAFVEPEPTGAKH